MSSNPDVDFSSEPGLCSSTNLSTSSLTLIWYLFFKSTILISTNSSATICERYNETVEGDFLTSCTNSVNSNPSSLIKASN